jgi:hypothetical protein
MYKPTLLQVFEKNLSTKPFSGKWNLGKAEIMHQLFFPICCKFSMVAAPRACS